MRSNRKRSQQSGAGLLGWSTRRWYVSVFAFLGLSACGLSAAPGVGKVLVDAFPTDVIFGAGQPSPSPVAPPTAGLTQPLPSFFTGNDFGFTPTFGEAACATAPATGAPAVASETQVTTKPVAGQYRWVGTGSYKVTALTTTLTLPVPEFFNTVVRKVSDFQDTVPALPGSAKGMDFTYETIQPRIGSGGGGFYDFLWQVKTQPQTGDPEGGLALKEITVVGPDGKQVGQPLFQGSPALLLLPLPVSQGAVGIQGPNGGIGPTVSADTSGSGNNMQFTGDVPGRERIDACGTWIQAWVIEGKIQSGSSDMADLHMDVATQFGALVVGFNLDGTFLGGNFQKMTTHTGQTTPDAIPKALQG